MDTLVKMVCFQMIQNVHNVKPTLASYLKPFRSTCLQKSELSNFYSFKKVFYGLLIIINLFCLKEQTETFIHIIFY